MKIKKILLIDDNTTFYHVVRYTSSKLIEIDITLGDVEPIFDNRLFEKTEIESEIKKTLFPNGRVKPIYRDDLNTYTLIILRLRPDHFLINTTFDYSDFNKEVLFDSHRRRLLYCFFNFNRTTITIRPKIAVDNLGLLDMFKDHLDDNVLRQTILDMFSYVTPPKETLENLLLDRADNWIIYRGDYFEIKFNGKSHYSLKNTAAVRDLVYLIQNKTPTDQPSDFWKKLHGKETIRSTAVDNMIRNRNRLLRKLKEIEKDKGINEPDRFSDFVEKHIKLTKSDDTVSYNAPESINWHFGKLPPLEDK